MKRFSGIALAVTVFVIGAGTAWAETSTTICVPEQAGVAVVSGTSEGTCTEPKYTAVRLPESGGLAALSNILPHMKYMEAGVGGKPSIQLSGVNLQIVNGTGENFSTNGEGNLVIGYDPNVLGL